MSYKALPLYAYRMFVTFTIFSDKNLLQMVSIQTYRKMALSFPEVIELPHFDRASFRVRKKIFSTILEKDRLVMVKLSLADQFVFCAIDAAMIYPVPGGWGKTGATYIDLSLVKLDLLRDALTRAYCSAAPKKLAGPFELKLNGNE